MPGLAPSSLLPRSDDLVLRGQRYPYDPRALVAGAEALAQRGRDDQAVEYLERAVWLADLDPSAALIAIRRLQVLSDDWMRRRIVPVHVHADELIRAQRRREGRELFASHHCAACHRTRIGEQAMFELSLAAPDLSSAGDRFGEQWLQQWLISPQSLRPQTHMPAVLGSGEQAKRDAADIAAFLGKQSSARNATETNSSANGEAIYEQLGCIACHHFQSPSEGDDYDRLSLHYASAKFPRGALTAFLKEPAAHHAASR